MPVALSLFLLAMLPLPGTASQIWTPAAPEYSWSWPRDHYVHREYRTEWWYFTGHLEPAGGVAGTRGGLAFQLTFFRLGMVPGPDGDRDSRWAAPGGIMAHASLIDIETGSHTFSEVLWREAPLLGGFGSPGDTTIAWCRAPAGTPGNWTLEMTGNEFRLSVRDRRADLAYDLTCIPDKPIVLHGDRGFSTKNDEGTAASLYASYTRMRVAGEVRLKGERIPVTGRCWMDQEFFTSTLGDDQLGWNWLSLQLEDGRDLMVYQLFGETPAADYSQGTLVDRDGTTRRLLAQDMTWQPVSRWKSPDTGAEYPVHWRLQIPSAGLDLDVTPVFPEQENLSPRSGVHYWEGAMTVRPWAAGDAFPISGRGFLELTGHGEGSRPPVW